MNDSVESVLVRYEGIDVHILERRFASIIAYITL